MSDSIQLLRRMDRLGRCSRAVDALWAKNQDPGSRRSLGKVRAAIERMAKGEVVVDDTALDHLEQRLAP